MIVRTKGKRVSAVFSADWHVRDTKPICRLDNFLETQSKKLAFIVSICNKYEAPLYIAGDVTHHWKLSPNLITLLYTILMRLVKKGYAIFGNHDLPQHNMDNAFLSGLYTLGATGAISILEKQGNFGQPFGDFCEDIEGRAVGLLHEFIFKPGFSPWPGAIGRTADEILKEYSKYDVILTGDNHEGFVYSKKGHLLVNPGSISRQTAAQIEYKPRIYLYYAVDNTVEECFIPIQPWEKVMTREYIDKADADNDKMDAFIEQLQSDWAKSVCFESNMENFIRTNHIDKEVVDAIYSAMEAGVKI